MNETNTTLASENDRTVPPNYAPVSPLVRLSNGIRRRLTTRQVSAIDQTDDAQQANPQTGGPPWMSITFLLVVVIPSALSLLYFVFIASDQYVAEARFSVRSLVEGSETENVDSGPIGMQASSQDASVVTSFIRSSEILKRLDGKIDYRGMFATSDADFIARFDQTKSKEVFLEYWMKHVSAYIDGPSGIVTLTAQTFYPEDSVKLVHAILEESEKLVNEMSVRAREDMLVSFRNEVARTGDNYREALTKLNQLQKQFGLLSPADQATQKSALLTGLLSKKMEMDSRLFVLRQSNGAESPAYRQLLLTRQSLEEQIDNLRNQLTGGEGASLSNVITDFTALETNRLVAEQLYESARKNYEQAFSAALKKALYLTVFVSPVLPDDAVYPRRLLAPFLVFIGLVLFWSTLALVWASVEDHRL